MRCILSILAFGFMLAAGSLFAQFTTASLSGIVRDSSGSPIPGARIAVQNRDTDLIRTVDTAEDGVYRFPVLPVGTYRLTVEKQGFSKYSQDGIKLNLSQAVTQNVSLELGTVTQQINVA